jgi:hypothetical protein
MSKHAWLCEKKHLTTKAILMMTFDWNADGSTHPLPDERVCSHLLPYVLKGWQCEMTGHIWCGLPVKALSDEDRQKYILWNLKR